MALKAAKPGIPEANASFLSFFSQNDPENRFSKFYPASPLANRC
jgi:hypothetical protein